MATYFFRLERVAAARPCQLAPTVRLIGAAAFKERLRPSLDPPIHGNGPSTQQQLVTNAVERWGDDAVLEVTAPDKGTADRQAQDAMAVLRFFMRELVRVNVEIHLVGLTGEIRSGIREVIALWEEETPTTAHGWNRIGGTVEFTFTVAAVKRLEAEPALRFLGTQLALDPTARSALGQRSLTAIGMYDTGLLSVDPVLRILCATIAVEVLYSDEQDPDGWRPQTLKIARRVAMLTCAAGCGRTEQHCAYSRANSFKNLQHEMISTAEVGREWRCSAFLDLASPDDELTSYLRHPPLFSARNQIAHGGKFQATDEGAHTHLIWVADQAVRVGLRWLAEHPDHGFHELDS